MLSLRLYDCISTNAEDLIGKGRPIDLYEMTNEGADRSLCCIWRNLIGTVMIKAQFLKTYVGETSELKSAALLSVKSITVQKLDLAMQLGLSQENAFKRDLTPKGKEGFKGKENKMLGCNAPPF